MLTKNPEVKHFYRITKKITQKSTEEWKKGVKSASIEVYSTLNRAKITR